MTGSADLPSLSGPAKQLERYAEEVLRWNRQFSLISRIDSAPRLQQLIQESTAAAEALGEVLSRLFRGQGSPWPGLAETFNALYYLDIGSGAGLPGLVWHLQIGRALRDDPAPREPETGQDPAGERGLLFRTVLIEAREKRAWFLKRVVSVLGLDGIQVDSRRWGDPADSQGVRKQEAVIPELRGCGPAGPRVDRGTLWLVSLRAVKMTDPEVLAGWLGGTGSSGLGPGDRLVVARFRSSGFDLDGAEKENLGLPAGEVSLFSETEPDAPGCLLAPFGPPANPAGKLLLSFYLEIPAGLD